MVFLSFEDPTNLPIHPIGLGPHASATFVILSFRTSEATYPSNAEAALQSPSKSLSEGHIILHASKMSLSLDRTLLETSRIVIWKREQPLEIRVVVTAQLVWSRKFYRWLSGFGRCQLNVMAGHMTKIKSSGLKRRFEQANNLPPQEQQDAPRGGLPQPTLPLRGPCLWQLPRSHLSLVQLFPLYSLQEGCVCLMALHLEIRKHVLHDWRRTFSSDSVVIGSPGPIFGRLTISSSSSSPNSSGKERLDCVFGTGWLIPRLLTRLAQARFSTNV